MIKTFEDNGVQWTLAMNHVFTKHKLWLEDFVNIPRHFSLRFATEGDYMRAKDKLLCGLDGKVKITGGQRIGSSHDVWFSAKTEEDAWLWKHKVFDPLFREQAVDFFRKNNYMPYNFANTFCHLNPGDTIRFHGRIPCLDADLDKINPLRNPQDWRIKAVNESKVYLSRKGKEYQIDKYNLFDADIFKREYLDKIPDYFQEINCASYDYFDPSYRAEYKPEIIDADYYSDGVVYTLSVAPERYIDIKIPADEPSLIYIMENEDGSTVRRKDDSFAPGYPFNEQAAKQVVQTIYEQAKLSHPHQFLTYPWDSLSEKEKHVADFLAYETSNGLPYPFAISYEQVTQRMVNDIVDRCTAWDKGLEAIDDELLNVCPLILGFKPDLHSLQNQLKKQGLSEQFQAASAKASKQPQNTTGREALDRD